MEKYKKVCFPIIVPSGDYCWDNYGICNQFDNSCGGHPECELFAYESLKYDKYGYVKKPKKCKELEEIK